MHRDSSKELVFELNWQIFIQPVDAKELASMQRRYCVGAAVLDKGSRIK
jgi:hypothetical protein